MLLVAVMGALPGVCPAVAEEMVFLRVDDLATLERHSLATSYAVESGHNFGGTGQEIGIQNRLQVGYAVTGWLKLSAEQNIKYRTSTDDVKLGVFVPQVRFMLGELMSGSSPVDLSTFLESRMRITARRDSSAVVGFGASTKARKPHMAANVGFEVTVPQKAHGGPMNYGFRYDLGLGFDQMGGRFILSAEVSGHSAWAETGFVEQEHHAGPSVLVFMGPVRTGLSAGVALQDRAVTGQAFEVKGMLTVGLKL